MKYGLNCMSTSDNSNQALFIQRETILKNENARLITIQIKRDLDGIKLYLKSPIFERYFKQFELMSDEIKWHGISGYQLPTDDEMMTRVLDHWGSDRLLMYNGIPNMAFLRMKGLTDGGYTNADLNIYENIQRSGTNNL